jgi:hypothetical protein
LTKGVTQRVSIGFQGGQVLALRITSEALEGLVRALRDGGWHDLAADDASVWIDLGQVVYVRTDHEARVGFGA